jgi:hypothetical protein
MIKEYEGTPQVKNILAAHAWHAQFALDEYVPKRMVLFQKGKKVELGELGAGLEWFEVGFWFLFLAVRQSLIFI